jgi:hypothetical protein
MVFMSSSGYLSFQMIECLYSKGMHNLYLSLITFGIRNAFLRIFYLLNQ